MGDGRLLFLYETDATFVRTDLETLRGQWDVTALDCSGGISFRQIFGPLRKADLSFSWFALGHAARAVALGKLLRRPSVVVAGGWDVLSMPEIGYGAARSPKGRRRARFILRWADEVLAFSQFSRKVIRDLSGREATLAYLGVDTEQFRPGPKEDIAVSVGNINMSNLTRKGMETFVRAAAQIPKSRFILAGRADPDALAVLRRIAPPNVEFPGFLSAEQLRTLFSRARVYVQVSYNEGFGLAVAEAMASGCVPVVTRAGSLPEVVGDAGFYTSFGDPIETSRAIGDALASGRGSIARDRIVATFPIARRRQQIVDTLQRLLEG